MTQATSQPSATTIPTLGRAKKIMLKVVLLGVLFLPLTRLVPTPLNLPAKIAPRFPVIIVAVSFFAWLHISAALLFLLGLKGFKQKVKQAYGAICIGSVLMGFALLQAPLVFAFNWFEVPFYSNGGYLLFPALAVTLLFFGVSLFAHELDRKKLWTRAEVVLPIVVAIALAGGLLASHPFNLTSVGRIWSALLGFVDALIVLHIKRTSTPVYANAMAWLFLALTLGAVTQAWGLVVWLQGDPTNPVLILPYSLTAILYVKAAYAFNKIGEY